MYHNLKAMSVVPPHSLNFHKVPRDPMITAGGDIQERISDERKRLKKCHNSIEI